MKDKKRLEQKELSDKEKAAAFLKIHYRFGHLSFQKLHIMAKQGVIDSKFARYPRPECAACVYAKLMKRQWRPKTRNEYENECPQNPVEVVLVDQMVSSTPGLIAQITGKITNKRSKYATIYVDQASHFGYVYL